MKNELRNIYKAKRREMSAEEVNVKSKKACELFLESDFYKKAKVLMLYMPLGNETDTTHIIKKAFYDGKRLAFPVTNAVSGEITPCYATEKSEFSKGAFSVNEPCIKDAARVEDIDVVLVPGIAFDKNGGRIGFGKGCYDRLLVKTNAVKIGFCYDFQLCDEIPAQEHDVKMDCIITENGVFECDF